MWSERCSCRFSGCAAPLEGLVHCSALSHCRPSLAEGWQHDARLRALRSSFVTHRCCLGALAERPLLRSQEGPLASLPYTVVPTAVRLSNLFGCLLRRLQFCSACWCGRPLDCLSHHRARCSRAGVLGRRGFALESAVARVCREAGARVSVNVFLRARPSGPTLDRGDR